MSSHDCRVTGTISIKEEVTKKQVETALSDFLAEHDLTYKDEKAEGHIQFDGASLYLGLDVYGNGGERNEPLEALASRLASIVDGWGYVEFLDFDTSGRDEACTPYFIGADEPAKAKARLMYGIEQMEEWVRPLIGGDEFERITNKIVNLPLVGQ